MEVNNNNLHGLPIIRERGALERDIALVWWSLPPLAVLRLTDGRRCQIIFPGLPGSSAGPDVRDAVLHLLPPASDAPDAQASSATDAVDPQAQDASGMIDAPASQAPELVGDVEFHLRASDWFAHQHEGDARYERVILHVVYDPAADPPILDRRGRPLPTCSLLDQPPRTPASVGSLPIAPVARPASPWPCQRQPLSDSALTTALLCAGLSRFQERCARLALALEEAEVPSGSRWSRADLVLLVELAEALGYGRDRAFFRAAGQRLLGLSARLPEPLGRAPEPAPLDARRLRVLRDLLARWQHTGAWTSLRPLLANPAPTALESIASLRESLRPLSRSRSNIVLVNVILPLACALAASEANPVLSARALFLYLHYPALPSNRVTRAMCEQLLLLEEPARACLQQGLQDVHHRVCREKKCDECQCIGQ